MKVGFICPLFEMDCRGWTRASSLHQFLQSFDDAFGRVNFQKAPVAAPRLIAAEGHLAGGGEVAVVAVGEADDEGVFAEVL